MSSASFSCPYPCPPRSVPRCVAQSCWRRTSSLSGSIASRRLPSSGVNCRCGNTRSSGSTSSRTNGVGPVQFLLVLRIGFEVPCHVQPSLGRSSEYDSEYQERNTNFPGGCHDWPDRRRGRPDRPSNPVQAGGPVRQRGPSPARCRRSRSSVAAARRRGPGWPTSSPRPGSPTRPSTATSARRRPWSPPSWRTGANACAATWPTRWPRSRHPKARSGAGSLVCWGRPTRT